MTLDEQRARAHKLGQQMRGAGFDEDSNPYIDVSNSLSIAWNQGYCALAGLIQAVNGWNKQQEAK